MNNSELLYKDIYHPLYKNTYPPFLRSFLRRKLLIVTEINDCNETNITKHIETLKNCDRYVIVENIKVTHKVTNDPDCVNHYFRQTFDNTEFDRRIPRLAYGLAVYFSYNSIKTKYANHVLNMSSILSNHYKY